MTATFRKPEVDPAFTGTGATDEEVEAIRVVLATADANEIASRLAAIAAEQAARVAADAAEAASRQAAVAAVFPWTIPIVPFTNTIFVQGTKAMSALGSGVTGAVYNGTGAQNDEFGWDVMLAAGTWQIEALMQKQSTGAIASVRLDGVEVGTWDTYAGVTAANSLFTTAGIDVATSGKKRLTLKAASRNPLNTTNYFMILQTISLRRTA